MGVRSLWDVIESCKKVLPLHHLQNKRVCIGLSCWIVQLHSVNKSHHATRENVYLKSLFHRLRALLALNCTLIFVADGSIPAIKLGTYRRRLNSGHEVTQDGTRLLNGTSLPRNMGSEFSCMVKEAKILGLALGIPCLDGIEEAEAQCALSNSESLCDGNQDYFQSRTKNDAQFQSNVANVLAKNEVIDLLSPSPQIHRAPRCQQPNDEHVNVINLSDSETELSPEHVRKINIAAQGHRIE